MPLIGGARPDLYGRNLHRKDGFIGDIRQPCCLPLSSRRTLRGETDLLDLLGIMPKNDRGVTHIGEATDALDGVQPSQASQQWPRLLVWAIALTHIGGIGGEIIVPVLGRSTSRHGAPVWPGASNKRTPSIISVLGQLHQRSPLHIVFFDMEPCTHLGSNAP